MTDEKPPLTEPVVFRRIFQGIYAILLLGFFGTIAVSATYGAFFAPVDPTESRPTNRQADGDCEAQLSDLFDALETTGQSLMTRTHELAGESEWKAFSDTFRSRLQGIRTGCRLDDPKNVELAALADHLERHRLGYDTALRSLRQIAGPSRAKLVDTLRSDDRTP